ncbi:hypothetical protein Tco_1216025 [Tanacetum coccineum]
MMKCTVLCDAEYNFPIKGDKSFIIHGFPLCLKEFLPSIVAANGDNCAVVIVTVIWVVIFVNVIVGVIIVVAIIGVVVVVGGVPSIIDLSFAGHVHSTRTRHHQLKVPVANVTLFSSAHLLRENTDSVRVPVRLLGLLALAMAAVCASTAVVRSAISCRMASKVMAALRGYDKDGDNDANGGNDDEREIIEEEDGEWIRFLGGNSSSGIKKYRGLNSNDGGNIEDGVKIAGEAIGSGDKIEFSEELKELLPDEAGK